MPTIMAPQDAPTKAGLGRAHSCLVMLFSGQ
jgi:hypothetical protein